MSDENKIRDAADAIKGIAEAVPVYQDVVQPAAKEVGIALQTVAKTIHIALAPVSALVWGYDKIKDYLDKSLVERLKDVPPERIITPNPAIAGPTVEALRFTAHDSTLRELYANLLATSMDEKTAQEAHPAFVEILRQLTPDEARLIKYLYQGKYLPGYHVPHPPAISGVVEAFWQPYQVVFELRHFSLLAEKAGCTFADLLPSYLDNLCRLGLTEIIGVTHKDPSDAIRKLYDELEEQAKVSAVKHWRTETLAEWRTDENSFEEVESYGVVREELRLTALGKQFCKACIIEVQRA